MTVGFSCREAKTLPELKQSKSMHLDHRVVTNIHGHLKKLKM